MVIVIVRMEAACNIVAQNQLVSVDIGSSLVVLSLLLLLLGLASAIVAGTNQGRSFVQQSVANWSFSPTNGKRHWFPVSGFGFLLLHPSNYEVQNKLHGGGGILLSLTRNL